MCVSVFDVCLCEFACICQVGTQVHMFHFPSFMEQVKAYFIWFLVLDEFVAVVTGMLITC